MVKQSMVKVEEKHDSSSIYRGVRKRKWGKYVSEIRLPNSRQRIWLGSYDSAEKAARAFDAAMFCLRGRSGRFNFPDNPPDIAGGRSMTPPQIQAAAAHFANTESGQDSRNTHPGRPEPAESGVVSSSSEGTALVGMEESPSPCVSEVTVQTDSDGGVNNGLLPDLFAPIGSGDFGSGYGLFPGFDEFSGDFYVPELESLNYCEEENTDGYIIEDSFLWNF